MLIYVLAGTSLIVAMGLMFYLIKNIKESQKLILISAISVVFIIAGLTVGLLLGNNTIEVNDVILFDAGVLVIYSAFLLIYNQILKRSKKPKQAMSTRKVAMLGLLIGIASVLQLMGFSVIPIAPYLKVELSALVIFMTLIWFDFKTAAMVSLITNIVHFFMPSSAPLIPFLDEMINFLATMIFIAPTAVLLKRSSLSTESKTIKVFLYTLAGFVGTVVLMVLFNQYVNLPLVYNIDMSFQEVIAIFGIFNIIKWGINVFVINLTWKRFLVLKSNI